MKHPAKYIGKKPRKYTIPAKPLAPNINDQVRIYSTNSTSGDGQVMHNTHSSQYLRVRLNLQQRHFLRVPQLDYYSNTCSELLCGLSILSVLFFINMHSPISIPYSIFSQVRLSYFIWLNATDDGDGKWNRFFNDFSKLLSWWLWSWHILMSVIEMIC